MPPAPGELSDTDVIVAASSITKNEAGSCGDNQGATMPPQDAMTASDSPGQSRKAGAVTMPSTADSVFNAESISEDDVEDAVVVPDGDSDVDTVNTSSPAPADPAREPEPEPEPEVLSASGRPSRRAARAAARSLTTTGTPKLKEIVTPEEAARRKDLKDRKLAIYDEFESLRNPHPPKGWRGGMQRFAEDLSEDLLTLRRCQELVAVSQFTWMIGKNIGIKGATLPDLEAAYQDADSVLVQDINAKLLRPLLGREDVIFSNWHPHFLEVAAEEDPELDLEPYCGEYKSLDVFSRVEITHLLMCWAMATPAMRAIINQPGEAGFRASELRVEPLGFDAQNNLYWDFGDMRVYRETPNLRKSFIRGKEAEDDDWNAICVTGHQWSALTRQFAKSTSLKEKAIFGILSNALPGILQQKYKEEMEKFRKANAPVLTAAQQVKAERREQEQAEKKRIFEKKERKRLEKLKARMEEQERLDREAKEEQAKEVIRAEAEAKERSKAAAIAKRVEAEERVATEAEDRRLKEQARVDRKKQRELAAVAQRETDRLKKEHALKVRQFRKAVRDAKFAGNPPPVPPLELFVDFPEIVAECQELGLIKALIKTTEPPLRELVAPHAGGKRASKNAAKMMDSDDDEPLATVKANIAKKGKGKGKAPKEPKKRRKSSAAEPDPYGGMFTTLLGLYPRKRLKNSSTGRLVFTTEMANTAAVEVSSPNPRVTSLKDWHEKFGEARKLENTRLAKEKAKAKYQEKVRAKKEEKERATAAEQNQHPFSANYGFASDFGGFGDAGGGFTGQAVTADDLVVNVPNGNANGMAASPGQKNRKGRKSTKGPKATKAPKARKEPKSNGRGRIESDAVVVGRPYGGVDGGAMLPGYFGNPMPGAGMPAGVQQQQAAQIFAMQQRQRRQQQQQQQQQQLMAMQGGMSTSTTMSPQQAAQIFALQQQQQQQREQQRKQQQQHRQQILAMQQGHLPGAGGGRAGAAQDAGGVPNMDAFLAAAQQQQQQQQQQLLLPPGVAAALAEQQQQQRANVSAHMVSSRMQQLQQLQHQQQQQQHMQILHQQQQQQKQQQQQLEQRRQLEQQQLSQQQHHQLLQDQLQQLSTHQHQHQHPQHQQQQLAQLAAAVASPLSLVPIGQTPQSATLADAATPIENGLDADGHPLTPAPWTGGSQNVKPVFDFGGGGLGLINDVEEEEGHIGL